MRPFSPAILTTVLVLLTACGTPQQRCIGAVTRDIRVVDMLIAETEANLARGYAFEDTVEFRKEFVDCGVAPSDENPDPPVQKCLRDVPYESRQPVAIDLNAEAAKLASLRQKRAAQGASVAPAIAQCQQAYPE